MLLHAVATQVPDGLQRLLASDAPLRFLCSPLMVSGVAPEGVCTALAGAPALPPRLVGASMPAGDSMPGGRVRRSASPNLQCGSGSGSKLSRAPALLTCMASCRSGQTCKAAWSSG